MNGFPAMQASMKSLNQSIPCSCAEDSCKTYINVHRHRSLGDDESACTHCHAFSLEQ